MKRRNIVFAATAALYAALLAVTWWLGTRNARENTEAELDYTANDIRETTAGALNLMLEYSAQAVVRHLGRAAPSSRKEMQTVADLFGLDEVNVIDRAGRVVATNDPDCEGVDFNLKDETREFLVLTNGTVRAVAQPFRSHAYNTTRFKYVGVPFPGGDGLLQVGFAESRLEKMIPEELKFLFDAKMEDTVCYLCANAKTGEIVSRKLKDGDERNIFAAGFDPARMPPPDPSADDPEKAQSGVTIETTLFGQKAFCRAHLLGGHLFIEAEPKSEFYGARDVMTIAIAILLALVLGAFAVFIVRIGSDAEKMRRFYAAEDERRAKDMGIAATIQASALPAGFPENPHVRLAASMTPAKDVGGDFYDYLFLDSTHLAFIVADVSGKGITAALYMMTAKTLIKNTLLAVRDPAEAFTRVNAELCRNNPANMFLTAWCGVLDFETGVVTFANAGHNPPVRVRSEELGVRSEELGVRSCWGVRSEELGVRSCGERTKSESGGDAQKLLTPNSSLLTISAKSGPMLAFMDGVKYRAHSVALAPGDTLFLYTDGVTEAMDPKGELFGDNRLLEALAAAPSCEPGDTCGFVRTVVAAFADGAPAADDLTVLAVRYVSRPRRFVRAFPPTQDGIAQASAFLDEKLGEVRSCLAVRNEELGVRSCGESGEAKSESCGDGKKLLTPNSSLLTPNSSLLTPNSSLLTSIHVILDEIASNIVKHAGASGFEVDVELTEAPDGVRLVFIDDGAPYDPLAHADPDTSLPAAARPIGGLGLLMVKKMSDALSYERRHNRNFLSVFKRLTSS